MRRASSSPRAGSAPRTTTVPSKPSRTSPAWSSCSTRTCSSGSTAGPTRSPSATASTGPASTPGTANRPTCPWGRPCSGMAGTAPGLILPVDGSVVVVLPGVPSELRRLWEDAPEHRALADVFAARRAPGPLAHAHLRHRRVARRRHPPHGRGRPAGRRDVDLRAKLRDRDRHPLRSGPRGRRRGARRDDARRARRPRVLDRRAAAGRDRARPARGAGMDGGDGRVVHRRDGRRRAHRHRRELGGVHRGRGRLFEPAQARLSWESPRASSRSTAP